MSLRIVFMGTPAFAAYQLEALCNSKHEVVGVVTMPDKPMGRGMQMQGSAVKQVAEQYQLPILQPEKLKDSTFLEALQSLRADVFVVVAFRMLPEVVWSMPPKGTLNLHASLLPHYRGAAPINWAIINGETLTGLTTFLIEKEIDTGQLLLQVEVAIDEMDTAESLHDKLMAAGPEIIIDTLDQLESNSVNPRPQPTSGSWKVAPKIFKDTCKVNWDAPAPEVVNFIRGLSPYPGAWTVLHLSDGTAIDTKLYSARQSSHRLPVGEVRKEGKHMLVGTASSAIEILELQLSGKKRLPSGAFMAGFDLTKALKMG